LLSEPRPYTPVETVVVSAFGSPAKRSEYVDIDVDLRWIDTESSYNVKRGTKRDLLKQITPVKKLIDFTYEGTVDISPPQSAKSDTKVTVEGSYADLMTRIDAQIRDSMTAQSEAARKVIRKEKDDAIQEIMLMKEYERNFCILVWKKDQVYERMAKALQIEDAKVEGYESLVNEYEMRYGKGSLTEEDIQHLRSPPERTKANELVHPKQGDARLCYQSLSRRLREDEDDDEEMMRYRRYYELGTGDTTNYEYHDDDESVTGVTVDREGVAVDREGVAADEAVDV